MENNQNVRIGRKKYALNRACLKKWLELEDMRLSIRKAADSGDEQTAEFVYTYLSAAFNVHDIEWDSLTWMRVAEIYSDVIIINLPKLEFPILKAKVSDDKKVAWEYEGRTWYLWSHLLMSNYSWHLDHVANLDVDDALALIQEILVEEQTAKEWAWSLSDIAYQYDENSKTSKFVPLEKPSWMSEPVKMEPIKKVKILRRHMPVGNIVSMVNDTESA